MTEKTILDTLRCTRELLSDPQRWTKGYYFRDANGKQIDDRELAESYCMMGAIYKCLNYPLEGPVTGLESIRDVMRHGIAAYRGVEHRPSITSFNDAWDTRHEDVLAALDAAIVIEEAHV